MFAVISSPDYFVEIEKSIQTLGEEITYKAIDRDIDLHVELNKLLVFDIKHLILDISSISDEERLVSDLKRYKVMRENTQIIIIAPNALPGNLTIHHLVTKVHVLDIIAPIGEVAEDMILLPYIVEAIESPASYKRAIKWVIDEDEEFNTQKKDTKDGKTKEGKTIIKREKEQVTQTVTVTKDRIIGTVVISVVGAMKRIGVTHTCISLARYVKDKGFKVCIIEYHPSKDFIKIKNSYEDVKTKKECFVLDGIDYYPYSENMTVSDILDIEDYNYAILDMGEYKDADINEFKRANKRIVVSGTKYWELEDLREILKIGESIYKNLYYFTLSDKQSFELIKDNMDQLKCFKGPINLNPFSFSKEAGEVFKEMTKDIMPENQNEKGEGGLLKGIFSKFK